jgi:hypothetical protein
MVIFKLAIFAPALLTCAACTVLLFRGCVQRRLLFLEQRVFRVPDAQ